MLAELPSWIGEGFIILITALSLLISLIIKDITVPLLRKKVNDSSTAEPTAMDKFATTVLRYMDKEARVVDNVVQQMEVINQKQDVTLAKLETIIRQSATVKERLPVIEEKLTENRSGIDRIERNMRGNG